MMKRKEDDINGEKKGAELTKNKKASQSADMSETARSKFPYHTAAVMSAKKRRSAPEE